MNKKIYETLILKLISHNDIKVSLEIFNDHKIDDTRRIIRKNGQRVFIGYKRFLLAFWILFVKLVGFKLTFKKLKKYKKVYVAVKGPKCHKKGKHILKYELYSYMIIIKKLISTNRSLNNIESYFYHYCNNTLYFNSNYGVTNKIMLQTYINI